MNQAPKCPSCGRPLPVDAPRKLCPACLFEAALASRSSGIAIGNGNGNGNGNDGEEGPGAALASLTLELLSATALQSPGGSIVFETKFEPSDYEVLASWSRLGPGLGAAPTGPDDDGTIKPVAPPGATIVEGTAAQAMADPAEGRWALTASYDPEALEPWTEALDAPRIPGYTITALLGRGGMGVVYKAIQESLKRTVALKMIRSDPGASAEQLGRFRLEAEAVARVRHPNIVQIYEVGAVGDLPYFSLEMLEGGTLAERLAGAPMAARQAAELALRLARGVDAVHRVEIVHRDLKPANVLFDVDGTPKIADFGLAKRLEVAEGPTVSGQLVGTPSYMAPEQAKGLTHQVGTAADIYALGAILYEMLIGRPPFKGPSMMETLHQVVYEEVVPPSRLQPKVPRDLETICLKCLAKEPSKRYPSAGELADDLGRFLAGETIRARPTPAWERAVKWARRRPARAAAAGFALLAALGLLVAAERYGAYTRSRDERIARLHLKDESELGRGYRQLASVNLGNLDEKRLMFHLDEARLIFHTIVTELQGESRLAELSRRAREALGEVEHRRAEAQTQTEARERLDLFGRLRDRALLLDGNAAVLPVGLTVGDGAGPSPEDAAGAVAAVDPHRDTPWKQVRDATRAALEVFPTGMGGRDTAAAPLLDALTPEQRAEVESDRFLLLLVLAEAAAHPLPGEDPRRMAGEALRLLDRAARTRGATPAFHFCRAACLERLGDAAAAIRARDEANRLPATDAFDHFWLGRESSVRGDWYDARKHFAASLRLKHDSFWARCWLAIAGLNSDPPLAAAAKAELTTCLLQQPSYAWLYLLRGSANAQLGFAQQFLARAHPKERERAEEAETMFEDAESDFRDALKYGLEGPFHYVLLMNRGVMRFRRERWEDAAADFTQAIALEPGLYHAYASLAQVLRKLGRRDEAVGQMDRAIARAPERELAPLYRGRALARLDRGDLAADAAEAGLALRDLEEAARRERPARQGAAFDHVRRGRLLLVLGRAQEALAAADAALAIEPDLAYAHLVRVNALLETGRYDELFESCDVALGRGAGSADLYVLRGLARDRRGDYAGAIDDYTHALARHPDDPAEVHRKRGWSHLCASSFALALHDFDNALRLAPGHPDGHAGRALARVLLGQVREAIADAEESLRRGATPSPPSPRLLYNAARTYAHASARAAAEVARRGRPASSDSLAYEARAVDLLRQALERTPADGRSTFRHDVIARDALMRPLFHNPRILQWFKSQDDARL